MRSVQKKQTPGTRLVDVTSSSKFCRFNIFLASYSAFFRRPYVHVRVITMKIAEIANGTHPPSTSLFRRDVMYMPSMMTKKVKNRRASATFISHTTIITTVRRNVVISITHITATPDQIGKEKLHY
jgi:hypothetical protein